MKIISRKEAIKLGLKTYFTGKPCKRGHVSEYLTKSGDCIPCTQQRAKERYENNKDLLRTQHKEYWHKNKESLTHKAAQRRKENPDHWRKNSLRRLYNMTPDQRISMLEEQEYTCAVCKVHEKDLKRRLVVDHCHKTGTFRGMLCSRCNLALGNASDSPELLRSLANYLEKT